MCGRYAFFSPAEAVRRTFELDLLPELAPRYNIAPTQTVAAIRAGGNRMINARSETLGEKPSFRDAFKRRRCLVVADGWYEWQAAPGGKQPWFVTLRAGGPIAFAGLWERWNDPANGALLESCTIVTTDAAQSIRKIHDRMPVVLPESEWARWLDTAFSDTEK